ncbi:MAG: COX15/CtaA family protein, partial [Flavobacteriia bacterium]
KDVKNKLIFLAVLILIQITYGAFVSGLKAGLFYNTFPKMGDEWFPQAIFRSINENGFSSFIENIAFVQFLHRMIGITLLLVSIILLFYFKKSKYRIEFKRQTYILFFLIFLQFILGIFTLLFKAPINLAIIHQFMAILIVLQLTKIFYLSRKLIYNENTN